MKRNRTTTLKSLIGVVGVLSCDTRDQFEYYYRQATSDDCGGTVWSYMAKKMTPEEKYVKKKCNKCVNDTICTERGYVTTCRGFCKEK